MGNTDRRIVFVGAATLDAIALVERFPHPDQRMVADEVRFAGGGPAATAAVAAARLGVSASYVGAVGRDEDGERIVAGLVAEGVDVSGVVRTDAASGASVVVVDRSRGTRAICNRPAPALELSAAASARDLLQAADWVHVDHQGWAPVRRLLAELPPGARPRLSVDGGNPIAGLELREVDLFVPTYAALVGLFPEEGGDPLARALAAGARTVVATCGADGAVAASLDGPRASVPGCATEVLSTLGAGDVFHGALLAAVSRGYPLAWQLAYANAAAALSCRGLDGRSAIPSHREVDALLTARAT